MTSERDAAVGRETKKVRETYAAAGVNIDAASRARELIKKHARATFRPEVLTDLGLFAGLFQLSGYKEPVLVSSVDGVGTKLKIAIALDQHDTIGLDLVNHCVNDILTCGAEPLFFLDYIAMGELVPEQVESIVSGLARACRAVGCALIGGETAEMPGLYAPPDYELVGFILGAVGREKVIDGRSIEAGDAILGLPSSGLHTNGYSLVRKVFKVERSTLNTFYPELGRTLGEELLEPHRCYYPLLKPVLPWGGGEEWREQKIKGMAHITGGGVIDNLPRVLPQGLGALFRPGSCPIPPIFPLIQRRGDIEQGEMYRVFNMGIGMALICSPGHVDELIAAIPEARIIGEVVEGRGGERVRIA